MQKIANSDDSIYEAILEELESGTERFMEKIKDRKLFKKIFNY